MGVYRVLDMSTQMLGIAQAIVGNHELNNLRAAKILWQASPITMFTALNYCFPSLFITYGPMLSSRGISLYLHVQIRKYMVDVL